MHQEEQQPDLVSNQHMFFRICTIFPSLRTMKTTLQLECEMKLLVNNLFYYIVLGVHKGWIRSGLMCPLLGPYI